MSNKHENYTVYKVLVFLLKSEGYDLDMNSCHDLFAYKPTQKW
jgi:hypothetical protein